MNFKESCQTRGIHFTLAAPEHLIINGQVKVKWIKWRTIAHSLMVNARVSEAYINFALMYTTDHIFPVLPIKDLMNKGGNPTITFKLATVTKPSVSQLGMLFVHVLYKKLLHTLGQRR